MFVCPECGAAQGEPGACPFDGAQVQAVGEDLLLGQAIGAYRVARLLGIGGMGRVYKGVHPSIGSRVAIKVLSRECSDRRDLVERFFAEAKAVNLIRHESIVNVLDLATLPDGRPFIIMEYLDGAPLSALVDAADRARTPLPLGGIARLAAEVLDALGAAHAKGIVHRDLKPDNIFVTPAGRPKVLDFGIAKLTDQPLGTGTKTGSLLGTPHYMAPEQASGRHVDHRVDIYAMGVILFECATGRKPFVAEALFDLLRAHVETPPPPPRSLRPDMPPELEEVILIALAKPPDQRFASANAMSLALQHATARLPQDQWAPITAAARPTGMPTPQWPSQPPSWARSPSGVQPPSSGPPSSGSTSGPRSPSGLSSSPVPMHPQAPAIGHPPMGHQTTVSAGQVTNRPGASGASGAAGVGKPGSKKGLVVALVAVAVVGGGIAAAVLASGGGGGAPATAASSAPSTSPSSAPSTAPSGTAATATSGATTAGGVGSPTPTPTPTPTKSPAPKRAPTNGDDSSSTSIARAVAEKPDDGGAAGAWFERHEVTPPARDMAKVDVDSHIRWAIAEAKKNVPDAQLFRIDLENVFPDGHADLTLPGFAYKYGGIDLRFISPSRMKRDPKLPRNVRSDVVCSLRVDGGPDGFEVRDLGTDCDEITVPPPRCKLAQVWAKALAKHADIADTVASIDYRVQGKTPKWWFTVYKPDHTSLVSEVYADDCP